MERASSTDLVPDGNKKVFPPIHNTKMVEAHGWLEKCTLVGRDAQMADLSNYLTKARFRNWRVMSVWGIAGVGKSALVRKFYYENMLERPPLFNKFGWANVVHPFNLLDFSRSLLCDFHQESIIEPMEIKGDPIQLCRKLLKEYQCLLVIDDLWSTEEWDLIQSSLLSRYSRSVIIVITTKEDVATYCSDNEEIVFNVKGLETEAAFHLFKTEVNKKNRCSPPLGFKDEKELEELTLKCGGLPKVIVSIGNFLAPKTATAMESARTMNRRFMHNLQCNPEFGGVRVLFRWLDSYIGTCPDFLKQCILYLSIFSQHQSIRRRRLLRRWIAEGYIKDSEKGSAEEIGEWSFSRLLDLCIVQLPQHSESSIINYTRTVLCQINRFVGQYILSGPMEENLFLELEESCTIIPQRIGRHLTIRINWTRDRTAFESIDFSRLRSLTVFGRWESFFISQSMRVLRVLDLEDSSGVTDKDLEKIVNTLSRLKFLSLRGCSRICHLPRTLGELRQLETLDIRHTSVVTIPVAIIKLKKLQYVRAGTTIPTEQLTASTSVSRSSSQFSRRRPLGGVILPEGIEKLTLLSTLGVFDISASVGKATLKQLRKLTRLRKLGLYGVNNKNCKEFCAAISCHVRLESLSVWLSRGNQDCLDDISMPQQKPLQNLQSLKLYGLVEKVPAWIKDLPKLAKLDLHMTISAKVDIIKVLGELKELCVLRLCVKPLQDGDGKLDFCVWVNGIEQPCYSKVKILEITCSSKLNVSFGSEAMQNLELLTIRCCSGSTLKFTELKNLSKLKLKEVRLISCQDTTLKDDMEKQLKEHPRKPSLKVEEPYSS